MHNIDIIHIKCPHCDKIWIYGPYFSTNKIVKCADCHKDYECCVVRNQLTNELVQAPYCYICKKSMTIIKSEHTERTKDYKITYIIHEWYCCHKIHCHKIHFENRIFIGVQTTGLIPKETESEVSVESCSEI